MNPKVVNFQLPTTDQVSVAVDTDRSMSMRYCNPRLRQFVLGLTRSIELIHANDATETPLDQQSLVEILPSMCSHDPSGIRATPRAWSRRRPRGGDGLVRSTCDGLLVAGAG